MFTKLVTTARTTTVTVQKLKCSFFVMLLSSPPPVLPGGSIYPVAIQLLCLLVSTPKLVGVKSISFCLFAPNESPVKTLTWKKKKVKNADAEANEIKVRIAADQASHKEKGLAWPRSTVLLSRAKT